MSVLYFLRFIYSVFATLVFPWVLAFLSVPDVTTILQDADVKSILEPMGCGVLWGVRALSVYLVVVSVSVLCIVLVLFQKDFLLFMADKLCLE